MKVIVLEKKDTPGFFELNQFLARLDELGVAYQRVDSDSQNAKSYLGLYDIVDYPAVLVIRDDGVLIDKWQKDLPTPENISHFYHQ